MSVRKQNEVAGCTFQPMQPSDCYTDHDDSGRYPKYAGPRALPNDPPGCGMTGKKVEGAPVCSSKQIVMIINALKWLSASVGQFIGKLHKH